MAFLLSSDKIPTKTVVAAGKSPRYGPPDHNRSCSDAAQCLYVLSDDNDPTLNVLSKTPAYIPCLCKIAGVEGSPEQASGDMALDKPAEDDQRQTLKVLACGILMNLAASSSVAASLPPDLERTTVLPLLVPILSHPIAQSCVKIQQITTAEAVSMISALAV